MWQYAVLSVASRHEGLSQAEIADRLGYSRNRIIHDLDVLEERGLAERRTGADRRRYLIHVTGPGRDTAAQVRDAIWSAEDALLSHVPAESRFSLQRLLEDVASTSAAREDPPPRSPRSDRD